RCGTTKSRPPPGNPRPSCSSFGPRLRPRAVVQLVWDRSRSRWGQGDPAVCNGVHHGDAAHRVDSALQQCGLAFHDRRREFHARLENDTTQNAYARTFNHETGRTDTVAKRPTQIVQIGAAWRSYG